MAPKDLDSRYGKRIAAWACHARFHGESGSVASPRCRAPDLLVMLSVRIGEKERPLETDGLEVSCRSRQLLGQRAGLEAVEHGVRARVGADGDAVSRESTKAIRCRQPELGSTDLGVPVIRASQAGCDGERNGWGAALHEQLEGLVDEVFVAVVEREEKRAAR